MKKFFSNSKGSGLTMFVIMLFCAIFGVNGVETVWADTPTGASGLTVPEGGVAVEGEISLDQALKDSPNLVMRAVHNEVIKVAPYDWTTKSLLAKNFKISKKTGDHAVAVYSATTKPVKTTVATLYTATATNQAAVDFGADNSNFYIGQNVILPIALITHSNQYIQPLHQ